MQTFLPYSDFRDSFSVLDNKRLGKQRVEAYQIISAITGRLSKLGKPYWILLSIFPRFVEAGEVVQFMAIEVDITERVHSSQELVKKQKEMELLNFQLNRQKNAAEELVKIVEVARSKLEQEILKSRQLQEQLRILASRDEMTGIANRSYFLKRAEAEFV